MTDQQDTVEISYVPDEEPDDHDSKDKDSASHKDSHKKKEKVAAKKLQHQVEEMEKNIEALSNERDEFKDKYLRNMAEIDNFRKRVKKEKEEYQKYVLSEFLLDLLQVYDNLDRALKAKTPAEKKESVLTLLIDEDEKSIVSGVEMIFKQFNDLLKKYNVIEIVALNKPFDPNLHQALSKDESETVSEPTVTEVYQKGFIYQGKLLKPSLVKVVIPKEKEKPVKSDAALEEEADA